MALSWNDLDNRTDPPSIHSGRLVSALRQRFDEVLDLRRFDQEECERWRALEIECDEHGDPLAVEQTQLLGRDTDRWGRPQLVIHERVDRTWYRLPAGVKEKYDSNSRKLSSRALPNVLLQPHFVNIFPSNATVSRNHCIESMRLWADGGGPWINLPDRGPIRHSRQNPEFDKGLFVEFLRCFVAARRGHEVSQALPDVQWCASLGAEGIRLLRRCGVTTGNFEEYSEVLALMYGECGFHREFAAELVCEPAPYGGHGSYDESPQERIDRNYDPRLHAEEEWEEVEALHDACASLRDWRRGEEAWQAFLERSLRQVLPDACATLVSRGVVCGVGSTPGLAAELPAQDTAAPRQEIDDTDPAAAVDGAEV